MEWCGNELIRCVNSFVENSCGNGSVGIVGMEMCVVWGNNKMHGHGGKDSQGNAWVQEKNECIVYLKHMSEEMCKERGNVI